MLCGASKLVSGMLIEPPPQAESGSNFFARLFSDSFASLDGFCFEEKVSIDQQRPVRFVVLSTDVTDGWLDSESPGDCRRRGRNDASSYR